MKDYNRLVSRLDEIPRGATPADLPQWFKVLSYEEFESCWVPALISTATETGMSVNTMASVLSAVRDRYRKWLGVMNYRRGPNQLQRRIIRRIRGLSQREIGRIFGITQPNVSYILKRSAVS